MPKPRVSVVIPTYNRAETLPDAVASVHAQTFRDVEIIVVDDGSNDNTKQVVTPLLDTICYIATQHRGAAGARNAGLKASTGEYIAFLDSDDRYLPEKLAIQVAFLDQHADVGLVCTDASATAGGTVWDTYHLRTFHTIYDRLKWSLEDVFSEHGELPWPGSPAPIRYYAGGVFRSMLLGPILIAPTALFRREILDTVGFQNESYGFGEEYEHLLRISRRYRVAHLDIPTYLYSYHPGQTSQPGAERTREKILTEIESEEAFLRAVLDWGVSDPAFYSENGDWLDHRVAELHYCIGKKWLECGDAPRARMSFREALRRDPDWALVRHCIRLSYLPGLPRRVVRRFLRWREA